MYRSTLAVYSIHLDIYAWGGMGGMGGIEGIGGMAPFDAGDASAKPW